MLTRSTKVTKSKVTLKGDYCLQIVNPSADLYLVKSISNLLTDSTEDFKESKGGHVPDEVVDNIIHKLYTSPRSLTKTFSQTGYRFAITNNKTDELVSTILISKSDNIIFVKDNRNLNISTTDYPGNAPPKYHCSINFATNRKYRNQGFGKLLLNSIFSEFRELFSGRGIWIRSEPPFHSIYVKLGFRHATEYDQFFEEEVSLPKGISGVWEFNKNFLCDCPKPDNHRENMKRYKYKYCTFMIDFSDFQK